MENNKQNFHYIYFIDNHENSITILLSLSEKNSEFNALELLEKIKKENIDVCFSLDLYRFKIFPEKIREKYKNTKDFKIKIIAQEENKNIFTTYITNLDLEHDNYLYDFKIDYEYNINMLMPIEEFELENKEKFQIFANYLRKNSIKRASQENNDLIFSTLNLFNNTKAKKYDFEFFISIFMESFESPLFAKFLKIFKPENIKSYVEIPEYKINSLINILNDLEKKIFEIFDKEENKEELILNFFTILLYISFKYNKEKIPEMFKNEKIKKYLYRALLINENIFIGLVLQKEHIIELMNFNSELNFSQLINKLRYNNDFLIVLEIIDEKRDLLFMQKYLEYSDKNCIDMETLILPKKEDDINAIYEKIKDIISFQNKSDAPFVKFTPNLIEKYIDLYDNDNLDKLFSLRKVAEFLKKEEKGFNMKRNIDEIIHTNGINFSLEKRFKNMELLNFIENDVYYQEMKYKKSNQRSVDILTGIDIKLINDEFLNKWKKLKLFSIFQYQEESFINKVCSLIKEMKFFNFLFKLLNKNEKDIPQKEYDSLTISKMQNKFEILFPTYTQKECPTFNDDVIDLIYYSDIKRENLQVFLKDNIQVLLNQELVIKIYITLSNKYKDISNNLKSIIIDFFTNNPHNNIMNIIEVIKSCKDLRKNILNNMGKYLITEDDLFQKEDTDNFNLLDALTKEGIFNNKIGEETDNDLESSEYVSESLEIKKKILYNIKKSNIKYSSINYIYDNNLEKLFHKRLLVLCNSDEAQTKEYEESLIKNNNNVKEALEDFNNILNDLDFFYKEKYSREIIELHDALRKIKNDKLSKYNNEYSTMHGNYMNKFEKDIKEREIFLNSIFFRNIYKKTNILTKDEDKCFVESKEKIKKLKIIFNKGIVSSLKDFFNIGDRDSNEKILENCLRLFKKKNIDEELNKEIDILAKICGVNYNYEKEKILQNLKLLFQKEEVLNITNALKIFIEKTGAKKTEFYEMINNIVLNILKKKDILVIKKSMDELEKYNIISLTDIKGNSYIEILKKLKEQPESIETLLNTNNEKISQMREFSMENDSEFLTANDISDFGKCVDFMKEIGNEETIKQLNDKDLIVDFRKVVNEHNKDNIIELLFNKYINNYGELKELMSRGYDNSEMSRRKIDFILEYSEFTLTNKKNEFFICKYNEKKQNGEIIEKRVNLDKLLEFRDRAQLSKTVSGDEKEKSIIKKNQDFIEIMSKITNVYQIFLEIYKKGYPKEITAEIKVIKGKIEFSFENKKYDDDYLKLIFNLNELLDKLKETLINAYKHRSLIRYIHGNQFNLLYNTIKNGTNIREINPLLQYFTNNLITKNIKNFNFQESGNIFEDLIDNCEKYLNQTLSQNNLTLEKIYKDSLIQKTSNYVEYKGLYIRCCDMLEKELFQIYKYLTSNIPNAQNVLLCNENTSKEELISFLYRAILCEYNSCFIVGGIESLNSEQKSTLLEMLNNTFVENHEKMNSCLIIIYTNKNADIYNSINIVKNRKLLLLPEKELENLKYGRDDIQIIYSDRSGVGKSYKIRNDIFNNGNKYAHFPFGGVIEQEIVIERLKQLKLDDYSEIHLDLYDTDQIQLMMEFLFSLLITKLYQYNENIFYFSKKIRIKIEIPNSFIDFFAKFPILGLFPKEKIDIKKLKPYKISMDITKNEQIVANYLKALKDNRINTEDLLFPMITPKFDESKVKKYKKKYKYNLSEPKIIPEEECNSLILEALKASNKIENPNYYQIKTFVNILGTQLYKFSQNYFLSAFNIFSIGDKELFSIRSLIVKNFINTTKYFTQSAFDSILKSQIMTQETISGEYNEGEDIKNAIDNLSENKSGIFSFEKIDSSLLFFHEGKKDRFSILTNKDKTDKEYITLLNLYTHYLKYQKEREEKERKEKKIKSKKEKEKKPKKPSLPDYKKEFTQHDFLCELKEILNIENPVEKSNKKENNLKSMKEMTQNYVFTHDNFTKMIFIIMRIRGNVPVIMMGETGCGKTALIRKLSELMNNGETDNMKIFNIHAGTTDQEIIDFINKKVIPSSADLASKETIIKVKEFQEGKIYQEKKIWVFLDEINTCKSMGLISELMCKNSLQGTPLPTNIIFIGACNPYRKAKETKEDIIGLDVNFAHKEKINLNDKEKEKIRNNALHYKNKLVYTVNPLPHSLLIYIFDFGNLEGDNEAKYIDNMIEESFNKICEKINNKNKLKELTKDMIIKSQEFIRLKNDISSVSLREIRRFNIFFRFFYKYLSYKKNNSDSLMENLELEKEYTIYKSLTETDLVMYSINLSIYICYYLRITNKNSRSELKTLLNQLMSKDFAQKYNDFLYIPNLEQKFIIKNIELEIGISKNKALLENIFSLFATINNKVPIFIVGKPGCSKSLSVQLINKAMKGDSSTNLLFKSFPKLIINSYQGSMGSTSKGVENIFKKARNILKNISPKEKDKNISMIFFDEMGLAEYSPNNPLKVIHSELEYDLNEGDNKVAFVGISNWILDASKMNRGIFISIPEADEEDTKKTAFTLAKSFNEILAKKNRLFFENLGSIYYNYKKYLREKHHLDGKEDFHGNRDFYHFVKNCAQNMAIKYDNNQDANGADIVRYGSVSIERNFAGTQYEDVKKITSVELVKNLFNNLIPMFQVKKEYDVIKRVKENINDLSSRYLLLESKSSVSTYLLSSLLNELNKKYVFYIGSKFEKDLKNEEYILKVLNKVQIYMEYGIILVMENLDSVYPAMYDLFNQNFTVVSNKQYARLAIGSTTNTYSLVNKNFRCIINVNINEMDKQEAPFLNRFEKQIISYDYLLSQELIDESDKIKKIINDMVRKKPIHKGLNYNLEKLLINCDEEEIRAIIYDANKKGVKKENMLEIILEKISLTLPQDILLYLKFNGFNQKYRKEYNKIVEYYEKGEHINLSRFIQSMKNNRNIVFTFSNDFDTIKNIDNINNPILGNINSNNTKILKLNSLNAEIELARFVDAFINDNTNKLCIIQFTPVEGSMMNYVKYFIDNKEKEYLSQNKDNKEYKKAYIFIMHIKRVFDKELKELKDKSEIEKNEINKKILKETISNLSGYYQIFIDNLNGDEKVTLDNILEMKGNEVFINCLEFGDELNKNIFTTIFYMKYNIISSINQLNKSTYINSLIHYLDKNKSVRKLINDCIMKQITFKDDLISKILKTENTISESDIDIICIVKNYLSHLYTKNLNLFYFKAEKDHFFSSLLSFAELENINDKDTNDNNINSISNSNLISKICPEIFGVKFKQSKKIEEMNQKVKNIIQKVSESYINNMVYNDGLLRITERLGANNIDIILGLNLPGMKTILDRIMKKVRDEICDKYYKNEMNLRESVNKGKELTNNINSYYEELKRLNNSTSIEIEKEMLLLIIENNLNEKQNEISLFYHLLLNDYYTLYIFNNLNKSNNNDLGNNNNQNENRNNENEINNNEKENLEEINTNDIKKFLKLLIELKNKYSKIENDTPMKMFANTINWLESYEAEITILLKMFKKLNNIVPNLYKEIDNMIKYHLIKYEISDINQEFISIVNQVFFIGMESILRVITTKINENLIEKEDAFTLFQNTNKDILQDAMQLNTILKLYSKELYSLQEIINLIDAFFMNNIATIENISKIISFYNSEAFHIMNRRTKQLCSNLSELYKFIYDNIGKDKDFYKIMNKILFNEFLKVFDEEYRNQILKIILKEDNFILNSTQILKVILKKYIIKEPSDNLFDNMIILSDEKNQLISTLNSMNSVVLDEILLNIFEGEIIHYFDSIRLIKDKKILENKYKKFFKDNKLYKEPKNFTGIVFDESFNVFQHCVEFLEAIIDNEPSKITSNLSKLYSIAYIKIYLKYFITFVKEKKKNIGDISIIVNFLSSFSKNNNNLRYVLKIYIFKLFNSLMNSFEEFKNFNYYECGIKFNREFSLWKENTKLDVLNYCFITLDNDNDKNNFNELLKMFDTYQISDFSQDESILVNNLNKNGIDSFLCIAINRIVSNLGNNEKKNIDNIDNFCKFANKIFNGRYACNNDLKKLLFLFFDRKEFDQKLKNKVTKKGNIDSKIFEMILYSFRFCVQTLEALDINKKKSNNKKLLFGSLLSDQCCTNLTSSFIPGNEIIDLHLDTLEFIENHVNSNPDNIGCYVCSCGYYYSIQPCGFPTSGATSKCPICKQDIGYGPKKIHFGIHGLARRPGHYRIFKDSKQHDKCMMKYNDHDLNIPNMTLADYKASVIEPIEKKGTKGLSIMSKDVFLKQNKKVRKLSELSYRMVHFLIYSHLLFANCLNYISDEKLKNDCLVNDMTCIQMLEKDWEFILEILQGKGIQSIQIFMNLIFKRISELIKNCEFLTTENTRNTFEEEFESIINKSISEYNKYSIEFIFKNTEILKSNNDNFTSIIKEQLPLNDETFPAKEYPLYKYFILTKYSNKEEFIKKLGPSNIYALQYPLLHQYLLDNIDTKKMKYLPAFNEFTNYMVDNYSFKISRDEAKKQMLIDSKIFKEKGFENKFINFINAWDSIKSEAIKYKCRPEMKPKNLDKKEKLVYFLNDDGELGYGMYIAAACQNFITWQNSFLQPIIDKVAQNGILHYFVKNMQRKIPVQTAKINQTLLIEDCFNNSFFYNFEDIIQTFSRRDIFKEDGTINYFNYNSFIYDFTSVEEELGKLLLPGKCLFEGEENLNFIAYWSEGFRGGKSDTLSNFYLKYPQKDLESEEKKIIIKYINKQKKNDFNSFFGSIQLIIFYLTQNIFKNEENIINIIKNAPQYLRISDDCYKFFQKDGKIFKLEKLMNIFFFIEHLCFKDLSETLQPEYKRKIPDDLKKKITKKLLERNNSIDFDIISIKDLAGAVRRYISRYLAGKRESVDIDEKRGLAFDLTRIDLWEEKIGKLNNLEELLIELIGEFKLNVGQAYEFYKIIEEKDLNPLEENLKK